MRCRKLFQARLVELCSRHTAIIITTEMMVLSLFPCSTQEEEPGNDGRRLFLCLTWHPFLLLMPLLLLAHMLVPEYRSPTALLLLSHALLHVRECLPIECVD
jgi:hypothetical protein